ncbi:MULTISPECIES: thioredoxin domain-containing protein [Butyricimonas]|uniref:thioredoxin domain-containing protein n=1 Tax=Butyricimonas TaxID=574697 RepID=UPI000B3AD258|nr:MULTISPECIES: thioredoxin domain-containing protein [Butyricimonas]OUN63398.1 hypothetical protein B5G13_17610 [Butyricimonas sp. An62]
MKKIISFAICILFTFPLLAQHGVNFRDLSYEQALEQAKLENKLLFIDCYTEWCGPCKKMMNEVFPQKAAGDFFNPRFVSVKFDMEKGEGKELSKKFDVHAYPTFLIVRTDGTVQHKLTGSSDLEGFIERVQKGLEEENTLPYQHQLYAKGEMSKQQLLAYKECLSEANDKEKAAQIYNELLEQLSDSDKMQKEFWGIYEDRSCQIGTPLFNYLLSNLTSIRENVGAEKVDNYLFPKYQKALNDYICGFQQENSLPVSELKRQVSTLNINQQEILTEMANLATLVDQQKIDKIAKIIEANVTKNDVKEIIPYVMGYRAITWQMKEPDTMYLAKLGSRLVKKIIPVIENKASSLTVEELYDYSFVFLTLEKHISKSNYTRLAAIGEKVIPQLPESQYKMFVETTFKTYKERSR